jgi:CheY-like chemotaxis protein
MMKLGNKASTLAGFMSPGSLGGQQRRIVRQALAEVASPERVEEILAEALADAAVPDVPEQLAQLSIFLFGALHAAIARAVDEEAARRVVDQLQAVLDASINEAEGGSEGALPDTQSLVLVVDPDVATRSQVVAFLKKNGLAAVSAPDDNVALAMCVRYRPAVVVAGHDATRRQQLAALLRVAFGGDAPSMVLLGGGEATGGVKAVVLKPVTEAALMEALRPLL